jgi:hypothetical protein
MRERYLFGEGREIKKKGANEIGTRQGERGF